MTKRFLFLFFLASHTVLATTWYVSGTGNDSNDGQSTRTAFRSLQKAADLVQPGDLVLVGNGTYTNDDKSNGSAVLNLTRSGTPVAWITWKAQPGHHPVVRPVGWCGIQISGSYICIDGLSVIGNNDSIVLLKALEDAKKPTPDPYFNTNGIFFNGRTNKPDQKPHHLIVRNCVVSNCPGGGIVGIEMDYLTVEDCRVSNNAWFMRYAGSGITTLHNWAYDDAPGYHIVIQRNFVWNNKTLVPWQRTGKLSDGNGILLDVTDQEQGATNPNADAVITPGASQTATQPSAPANQTASSPKRSQRPEWKGRALIANNVSAYNGGSGIHTFRTSHVDITNNTTYWNGQIVGYQELFPNRSDDIVILNNIIVPRPGGQVTSNHRNTAIRWDYNVYPVAQAVFSGPNDLVTDVAFIDVQPDPTKGNFRLAKGSPALNSATNDIPQTSDILGKTRPSHKGRDRGAFEQ